MVMAWNASWVLIHQTDTTMHTLHRALGHTLLKIVYDFGINACIVNSYDVPLLPAH